MGVLVLACSQETTPTSEPETPVTTQEVAPIAAELAVLPEGAEPIQIEIVWDGIGALYKSFFTKQQPLTDLSKRLSPHLVPPAQLYISWNQDEMLGGIRLVVPPEGFRTPPTVSEGLLAVGQLAPITVALATYRDELSGLFDIRIQSFVVGIDRTQGPAQCRIGITGTPPPDGARIDPCLQLNGRKVCGAEGPGGIRFTGKDLAVVRRCFD